MMYETIKQWWYNRQQHNGFFDLNSWFQVLNKIFAKTIQYIASTKYVKTKCKLICLICTNKFSLYCCMVAILHRWAITYCIECYSPHTRHMISILTCCFSPDLSNLVENFFTSSPILYGKKRNWSGHWVYYFFAAF